MPLKNMIRAAAVIVVLAGLGFGAWIATLPPARAATAPAAIPAAETEGMLAALRRPARQRPVVAVIGINDATETTDYLMPLGILRRADVAEVVALATAPGPVKLYPALSVEPDATVAAFDARRPEGADYVIVPAMSRDDDPAVLRWIRGQAGKGATIVGVCAGAKVVAAAGLLAGKRATTHWYYLEDLLEISPTTTYVPNRRFVADGAVVTTTGITASMPMMLTVIEAIAGADRAASVARGLGVGHWDARHASSAFGLTRPFALTVLGNRIRGWAHEELALELSPGMDEVSLALQADTWSRTYRSRAVTFARTAAAVGSRNGIRILPDRLAAGGLPEQVVPAGAAAPPAAVLEDALAHVEQRYGRPTADVVAVQLEYPWPGRRRDVSR
jgi:transcriptional regulator GlxA family with amidase domain